jgi:hypothetical protein
LIRLSNLASPDPETVPINEWTVLLMIAIPLMTIEAVPFIMGGTMASARIIITMRQIQSFITPSFQC